MQPNSFFGYGYPRKRGAFKSWILQARDAHGTRELFGANRWTHVCLAYQKKNGFVKVIRVSRSVKGCPWATQFKVKVFLRAGSSAV